MMGFDYRQEIESMQNGIYYDPDSSPKAWEHYRRFYTTEHWSLLDEFNLIGVDTYNNLFKSKYKESKYKRLLSAIKPTSRYAKEGKLWSKFCIGGDTDFNFNSSKAKMMKDLLVNDVNAILKLEECQKYHHSLVNFSLMPATGGLNNYKGKNRYDRFDVFIKDLNSFFLGLSGDVLNDGGNNIQPLKNFLNTFQDIYDYCKKVYFIDDKIFVNRIISEGFMPIKTGEDVVRYMKLAMDFWNKKEEDLKIKENNIMS
jgi:hypothetical protein